MTNSLTWVSAPLSRDDGAIFLPRCNPVALRKAGETFVHVLYDLDGGLLQLLVVQRQQPFKCMRFGVFQVPDICPGGPRCTALECLLCMRIERGVSRAETRFLQIPGHIQDMNQFAQQMAARNASSARWLRNDRSRIDWTVSGSSMAFAADFPLEPRRAGCFLLFILGKTHRLAGF
jgi:hypothetical protein